MNQLQFQGFSKNLRYVFTNRGIYDFVEDKSMKYESLSLIDGINILQEVQKFEYQVGKITLQEHTTNPRRAIIALTNILFPENSTKILKEWETNFGNKLLMLNESTDNLIIEQRIEESWEGIKILLESWVGDAWDWTKKKAGQAWDATKKAAKWVGEKAKGAWNWIKEKATAAWNCLKNNFVECLMEGLRSAMMSVVGIAVETFLAVTGIGAPIPMILWGLMLIWDVYKMFSGKYESGEYAWSWFDIVIDIVGVATAGTGAAVLSAVRGTFRGTKTISSVFAKGSKMGGAVGNALKSIGQTIGKVGSSLMSGLKSAADWIAKNFGIKWFSNYIGKAKGVVDDIGKAASGKTVPSKVSSKSVTKTGEEGLSTWGKFKKGYGQVFDKTVGQIGKNKQLGKTTLGTALSKTAQTAVPVAGAMQLLGVNPLTGKPYESQDAQMAQNDLEKEVDSLTTGTADYEAAGLI